MDEVVERMAIRLAERIAPDEVELAPAIAEAAVQGGKEWQAVISSSGGAMLGGVDPGSLPTDLAMTLSMIKDCATLLSSFVLMTSAGFTIRLSRQALRDRTQREHETAHLPPEQRETVHRTADATVQKLDQDGMEPERTDEVVTHTLHALQEMPDAAEHFLRALGSRK